MNWLNWRKYSYVLSVVLLLLGLIGVLNGGLKFSLEFQGGAELVLQTQAPAEKIKTQTGAFLSNLDGQNLELQSFKVKNSSTESTEVELTLPPLSEDQKSQLVDELQTQLQTPVTVNQFRSIGPSVSAELINKTLVALALGTVAILFYVWLQFKDWRYGLAAVLAMLHDSAIVLGAFAWLGLFYQAEIDLLFVTALLTTLSFSVHDTIVIFERLERLRGQMRGASLREVINTSLTQTLTRSINNSLTIFFMLLALVLLGGSSLHWFALALLIGTVTGTYSSSFLAAPLYFDLRKKG